MGCPAKSLHAVVARLLPVAVGVVCLGLEPGNAVGQIDRQLVRSYLWPESTAAFERAAAALASDPSLVGVSRGMIHDVAEWMRAGPITPAAPTPGAVGDELIEFDVSTPGGRTVPVLLRLPSGYTHARQWPLMLAMHGGPPGSPEAALRSARSMINVWAEAAEAAGWIVVSPAMVDVVSRDGRTQDRLPYEIFHPEEARAVVDAVRARVNVNPDRLVSTGISLGSNFSIAFGAAHPDWLSAIVPVSTEGDSREHLLRNLAPVPTYVLEGSQDRNIRGVNGPRSLADILTAFGADLVYREFSDRAHEGFAEHYPDVLRWLDSRPRESAPREVIRVPHDAIVPVARRVSWVESHARQGLVHARVLAPSDIDITARWTRGLTLYLNDELVDLDRPVTVRVNGVTVFQGAIERSVPFMLEQARLLGDERRIYSAMLTVEVPTDPSAVRIATEFWDQLAPTHPEGLLSFWEMYAANALDERFPALGIEAVEAPWPGPEPAGPEQVAMRVTAIAASGPLARAGLLPGDVMLSFGGEPFFRSRADVASLRRWLVRELRETPRDYPIVLMRDGTRREVSAAIALGPYRPPE